MYCKNCSAVVNCIMVKYTPDGKKQKRKIKLMKSLTNNIVYSHKHYSARNGTIPRHCHDKYEILLLLDGEGRYIVEGCEYNISPGAVMFTRPFEYHCIDLNPDLPYERSYVQFPASALSDDVINLLESFNNNEGSGCFYPPETVSRHVSSIFERFSIADTFSEVERGIYLKLLTSELVVLLSSAKGQKVPYDEDDIGAKVLRYINDHLERDISLDKLSKRFFVSKYYLCRAFKKKNGVSIHGYITHKRIMYAKQLIDNGETASGAAYKVGFGDYSAFYRAYVKIIGRSPSAEGVKDLPR